MASQSYSNPVSRNVFSSAGNPKPGSQGAGMLNEKVNVPLPGTNTTQPPYKGGMKSSPAGFSGGIIPGKI